MLLRPASFCFGTLSALLVFYCYGPQYTAVTDYVSQSETEVPRNDGQATDEAYATQPSSIMSSVTNRTLGVSGESILLLKTCILIACSSKRSSQLAFLKDLIGEIP